MSHSTLTKTRHLRFTSLEELEAELDRLEAASRAGTLTASGNWSLGQCAQHISKFFDGALSGFEGRAPWIVRVAATALFKRKALGPDPMPAGIKLPKNASSMLPDPDIADAEGLAALRRQIARVRGGEQFSHPSAIFGRLTHDEWLHLQLKHAALHLGFQHPGAPQ